MNQEKNSSDMQRQTWQNMLPGRWLSRPVVVRVKAAAVPEPPARRRRLSDEEWVTEAIFRAYNR